MAWKEGLYINEVSPRDLSLRTEEKEKEDEEEKKNCHDSQCFV